tara:strand:+ start:13666 stop:14313 length:648 start_codon:yes stop_codon:yes gene_type:complete
MSKNCLRSKIKNISDDVPESISNENIDQFIVLLNELHKWNQKFNLTSIRNVDDMIAGHLMDSLSAYPYVRGDSVVDIGTGAGFPGLPLAIINQNVNYLLVDSNGKKIGFINHVINLLEIKNVKTKKIRIENFFPDQVFDTVIARALSSLPKLIKLSQHLLKEEGVLIAMKGKHPSDELRLIDDSWAKDVKKVSVERMSDKHRHIVLLHKKEGSKL